jgi:hypothetical protein
VGSEQTLRPVSRQEILGDHVRLQEILQLEDLGPEILLGSDLLFGDRASVLLSDSDELSDEQEQQLLPTEEMSPNKLLERQDHMHGSQEQLPHVLNQQPGPSGLQCVVQPLTPTQRIRLHWPKTTKQANTIKLTKIAKQTKKTKPAKATEKSTSKHSKITKQSASKQSKITEQSKMPPAVIQALSLQSDTADIGITYFFYPSNVVQGCF